VPLSGTDALALGRGFVTPCVEVGATGKADGVYNCVRVVYAYVFHWWLSKYYLFLQFF